MDKAHKLKRYRRKDYSQVVDFPVEIVGRDGVVRHYSFEASVRLYQRRIASAWVRYTDQEVATAEIHHCRRRIDQLRCSYFERFGWAGARAPGGLAELAGAYAGEVVAFLHRYFGSGAELDGIQVTGLDQGSSHQTFFVQEDGGGSGHLLYLYRFEQSGNCESREAYFELLRSLRSTSGSDAERLVAFHHAADCGLVLSGAGREPLQAPAAPPARSRSSSEPGEGADPYRVALWLLATGQPAEAMAAFEAMATSSPLHRKAHLAAATLGELLGRREEGEMLARMGLHYFPGDPALAFQLGVCRFRAGDMTEAVQALELAAAKSSHVFGPACLLGLARLAGGGFPRGYLELWRAMRGVPAGESDLAGLARRLLRIEELGVAALGVVAVLPACGLLLLAGGSWAGLPLLAGGVLAWGLAWRGFRRLPSRVLSEKVRIAVRVTPIEGLAPEGEPGDVMP